VFPRLCYPSCKTPFLARADQPQVLSRRATRRVLATECQPAETRGGFESFAVRIALALAAGTVAQPSGCLPRLSAPTHWVFRSLLAAIPEGKHQTGAGVKSEAACVAFLRCRMLGQNEAWKFPGLLQTWRPGNRGLATLVKTGVILLPEACLGPDSARQCRPVRVSSPSLRGGRRRTLAPAANCWFLRFDRHQLRFEGSAGLVETGWLMPLRAGLRKRAARLP